MGYHEDGREGGEEEEGRRRRMRRSRRRRSGRAPKVRTPHKDVGKNQLREALKQLPKTLNISSAPETKRGG